MSHFLLSLLASWSKAVRGEKAKHSSHAHSTHTHARINSRKKERTQIQFYLALFCALSHTHNIIWYNSYRHRHRRHMHIRYIYSCANSSSMCTPSSEFIHWLFQQKRKNYSEFDWVISFVSNMFTIVGARACVWMSVLDQRAFGWIELLK